MNLTRGMALFLFLRRRSYSNPSISNEFICCVHLREHCLRIAQHLFCTERLLHAVAALAVVAPCLLRADVLERIEQAQAMTSQALMSMPRTVMTPNTVRSTLSHLDGTCQPVAGCPRGPRPRRRVRRVARHLRHVKGHHAARRIVVGERVLQHALPEVDAERLRRRQLVGLVL